MTCYLPGQCRHSSGMVIEGGWSDWTVTCTDLPGQCRHSSGMVIEGGWSDCDLY